jgi:arabinogalactan oligomer/maltooligosaccharide transport system permease protein
MNVLSWVSRKSRFIVLYGLVAVLIFSGFRLLQDRSWFMGLFFFVSSFLIIYIYAISKKIPGKYLLPGVLLLILFQIYPSFYSGVVAFTNDSNGHQLSKVQAIDAIIEDSMSAVPDAQPIPYTAAVDPGSQEVLVIFRYPESTLWIANSTRLTPFLESDLSLDSTGKVIKAIGYDVLSPTETEEKSLELQEIKIRLQDGVTALPLDYEYLEVLRPNFIYSASNDELTDLQSGTNYKPNDNGQMASQDGELLYPGWKTYVGWRNFSSIITEKEIRAPIVSVLTWTIVNAFLVVVLSFLLGLTLALIFNSPHLRSKRLYRTIFITPLAIPSVLSVLVWAGLFTTETGVIDRLFHISTPWLTDAIWARVAVLIVELWISFPYMFLITTGAIQAIPHEIIEAASIDGATHFKSFSQIKLPLVLRTVAPLLVASGAMALNNFGVIYLLTSGGPTFANSNGNAGATDILISYTYKLAFNANEGNNYGLASALSILNFLLIAGASVYGLRKIKTMEGIN